MSNAVEQPDTDENGRPWLVWLGLPLLFIGCGLLTVAVVELASNKSISAVTSIIGGPMAIVGLIFLVLYSRRVSATR